MKMSRSDERTLLYRWVLLQVKWTTSRAYTAGTLLTAGAAALAIVPSLAFRDPKPASRDPEHAPKQREGTGATRAS